ncbi:Esterase E4 [Eumeta japonica]|uniref:Carboxylic ester hydrolase n=1 Tax=Eumeta variegata TaxID=151549 RepID=A0A4C1XMW4_EUMVA|nr:Esterase E4 [Eumeta japonica]
MSIARAHSVFVLCIFVAVSSSHSSEDNPTVTSPAGSFIGSLLTSRRGRTIYSFRGIRYAESPEGELRFKPPVPIDQYPQPVDAREDGPACPQSGTFYNMSEDCLRLNVYSPRLPVSTPTEPLPVLVYFHPGGFYSSSGLSIVYGPQYLLDRDIVLVTLNYRLATLGLLATGDEHAPGNNALKDQVVALRWVQRNIRAFGGNPDSVTIWGYSAGSTSVALHMVSPMSRGLFHRAISMSSSPISQRKTPLHQLDMAKKQAELVGCPTDSTRAIVECLRTKSWQDLAKSYSGFSEFGWDPILRWSPVVEPDLGRPRFLPATPEQLISEGRVNDVPFLVGTNQLEFIKIAFMVLSNDTLRETMHKEWTRIAPISFKLNRNDPRNPEIASELRRAYIGDRPFTYNNDTAFALGRLYADGITKFGMHRLSRVMSETLSSPVYYYQFNYTGTSSYAYYPGTKTPFGAVHHDELIYLFHISALYPFIGLDSPHSKVVDLMTTMWTNFVIRGDPNPSGNQPALKGLHWPKLEPDTRKYLQINQHKFEVRARMNEDRFALWERLFPLEITPRRVRDCDIE